jgi:hypothetical protein
MPRWDPGLGGLGALPSVPIGYLVTVTLVAWCTLFALAPPRPAHSSPSNLSFWFGYLVNELPFLAFYGWILTPTILAFSDLDSPGRVGADSASATSANEDRAGPARRR